MAPEPKGKPLRRPTRRTTGEGGPEKTYGAFVGELVSVADAGRKTVALGLAQVTADMLYILTDSQSVLRSTINISKVTPPGAE